MSVVIRSVAVVRGFTMYAWYAGLKTEIQIKNVLSGVADVVLKSMGYSSEAVQIKRFSEKEIIIF